GRTAALEEQISQRKEAQLRLIKSERYYRRLIENISDIITIIDSDGVISYTSPSVQKLIGLSPASVIGHNIRELLHPDDVMNVDFETLFHNYSETRPLEYRTATRDGHYKVLESHIQKIHQDDDTDGYILSSRDITERKYAEEEMHKLRMVVEQSPSSVVITDIEGTIEYVNPAFEEITGYSSAEAVGLNPRVLNSGQTPESAFTQLWKTITTGHIWRGEFINKKKSGELYDENVLVVPIKNINGEITNFVAVKENITELKRARKYAEQANQAKSNFLSQMSHELRTPLNAINGFSQLMLKSKKNPLNEKQQGMTEQIHTAGQHLLQLINEVLDLARIESGEFSLSIEPLDSLVVLNDCLSLISSLAKEQSITITRSYAGKEIPLVRADFTRLKQVLLNFLSNAVKYNKPQGTVTIDVEMDIPGFLRFIVADNGIGIPEEKQKDLFTPFTRAVDNPDDIEGTGIGMTITKQLVEKMGGDIGFESQLGQGSRFWFTLPVSVVIPMPEVTREPVENKNGVVSSTEREQLKLVLYVEDNPTNVAFMQDFFSELEDLKLVIATTGEEGVSMALKNIPDLILMDLNLPGIDGFQAYRQIKANPKTEFVPVVVVSADAMEKTVKRIHKMGFDGYIPKPVDVDLLRKTMTDIFKG
ncbi:MAG: PAS domain S-box protein, partial [Desulfuromusa sp.]